MEKYTNYTADDFVMDDKFKAWVSGQASEKSAREWSVFLIPTSR